MAGRDEIRLDITADPDPAVVAAKYVAKMMEKLEEEEVKVRVDADTSGAEKGLDRTKAKVKETDESVGKLGNTSDQSRSVLANMVGNSTQDLGELGGVAGSAGVAIGQIGEYAADGNIALKNLAATAIPLLAVAIAVKGITKEMERNAKAKAFDKERVEEWTDALKEGATAAEAITDSFREAGKVEVNVGGHVLDLTKALEHAGLTAEEFTRLTLSSAEEVDAWGESMRAAGVESNTVAILVAAAKESFDEVAASEDAAATNAEVFADRQAEVREALDRTREATERATTAQHEWLDEQLAAVDASFAHHDALRDFEAAVRDSEAAMADGSSTIYDLEAAWRSERQAALDAAGAAARLAEEQAAQAGATLTAEERLDALNTSLLESARQATPQARAQIEQYLAEVNGIPPAKATEIVANADTAAAARELDEAANPGQKPRPAWIEAGVDNASLQRARAAFDQALGGWGGFSVSPTNITVNAPQGMSADAVIAAATRYARRNGGTLLTARRGRRR